MVISEYNAGASLGITLVNNNLLRVTRSYSSKYIDQVTVLWNKDIEMQRNTLTLSLSSETHHFLSVCVYSTTDYRVHVIVASVTFCNVMCVMNAVSEMFSSLLQVKYRLTSNECQIIYNQNSTQQPTDICAVTLIDTN